MKTEVFGRAGYVAAALVLAVNGLVMMPGAVYADDQVVVNTDALTEGEQVDINNNEAGVEADAQEGVATEEAAVTADETDDTNATDVAGAAGAAGAVAGEAGDTAGSAATIEQGAKVTAKATVGDFAALKEALDQGETNITLTADIAATESVIVRHVVTLNGGGYTLSSTARDGIQIQTEEAVVINDLRVTGADRAVGIWTTSTSGQSFNITINGMIATVGSRGVTVNSDANTGATLTVRNSMFQAASLSDYSLDTPVDNGRGVSLWEMKNSTVTIENSILQGFAYVVNLSGSDRDFSGTTVNIDDCTLRGRDGVNNYASNVVINISDSLIHGVNNYSGPTEAFADIVLERGTVGVRLNIDNVEFTTHRGVITDTNKQYMIANRAYNSSNPNMIRISGETSFFDETKGEQNIGAVFEPDCNYGEEIGTLGCPDIEISGGMYDYGDVEYFVAEGKRAYQVTEGEDTVWVIDEERYTQSDNLSVEVDVAEKVDPLTNEEEEQINAVLNSNGGAIAGLFDIDASLFWNGLDTGVDLDELEESVTIGVTIPEAYRTPADGYVRTFYMIRYHNGVAERLDTAVSSDGTRAVFQSDKFSTYALAYVDTEAATSASTETVTSSEVVATSAAVIESVNPETGDKVVSYAVVTGLAIIAMAGAARYLRKEG